MLFHAHDEILLVKRSEALTHTATKSSPCLPQLKKAGM